ncbi:DUF3558 family protein [Pseudonocardia oroxyli]|uniref:DUF3558 family protein n=1 Tax=Pseudonocardia oroxyli TaxID=366584 RepID=UPI0015A11545|nr:DUF3558 family protein [Pseudonocardia oroxyli]
MITVSGCSASSGASAVPESTDTAIQSGPPLDVSGQAACTLLSVEFLEGVSVDPTTAIDDSNENASSCVWRSQDGADNLAIAISQNYSLERITAALEETPGSERMTVKGYQAAREGPPDSLICTIYTAVSERHLFSVEFGSRAARPETPCTTTERVASAVIDALAARSR